MIAENIYLRLISEAAKAPSGHNTQPPTPSGAEYQT
jgi:hypothetical protein